MLLSSMTIHTAFIVPYRDRAEHKIQFMNYFEYIRERSPEWSRGVKLLFVHQKDNRLFNRGAMKNIGAIHIRRLFPHSWESINLVFHDIDTLPMKHVEFSYSTPAGVIAHYYGAAGILGGIVVIKAADFMAIGGFPNIWGWGYEDNALYDRAVKRGLRIDCTDRVHLRDFSAMCRLDAKDYVKTISERDIELYRRGKSDSIYDVRELKMIERGHMLDVMSFNTLHAHPARLRKVPLTTAVPKPEFPLRYG